MLSIVVITRNEEHNIQRTLTSCIALNPLEIIVVDSDSTDNTRSIVQKNINTHSSIKLYTYNTAPFTAARGRNIGIDKVSANANMVLFLDGDMEINKDFLITAVDEFSRQPTLGVLMGQMDNFYYDHNQNLVGVQKNYYDISKHTMGGAMLVSRESLTAVGGFNSELVCNEESEFEYRLNRSGYHGRRIDCKMINHHTEAQRSTRRIRSMILNRRLTGLGINLHIAIRNFGYLKKMFLANQETFLAALLLLLAPFFILSNNFYTFLALTVGFFIYTKIKSKKIRYALNHFVYASGMIIGFLAYIPRISKLKKP
ncbi:glycosyltransferase [Pseudomonas vancouverensis]|nr:glycosyltransferase [Pseudomonas vancouverensis]SDU95150.1 Glycosyltransferase, catalytic subunit of cellulose synthase and poly-beta-1,6-N-acetylglucosamine synthase [Pseudomonas vancouverensis]